MAAGVAPVSVPGKLKQYDGHVTVYLVFACIVASSGSFLYGYDLGISGGVTSMDDFLEKFFPVVYRNEKLKIANNYCRYNSQTLQLFTSSLYLAGTVSTFFAGYVTSHYGRKPTMFVGGVAYLIGGILNGAAPNLATLIIGRLFLGVGLGFANQAVPLYVSEMAPPKDRGFLFIMSTCGITIGVLAANLINYRTWTVVPNGWRISLGLAVVPAVVLTLGGMFLPETPNSLVERGHGKRGREVLETVRGVKTVDTEFEDLVEASLVSRSVISPWRNLLKRQYRPQVIMGAALPILEQLTGNLAITFYAPVLFRTIGFGSNAALFSAAILGSAKVLAIFLAMPVVDRWGRKVLFYQGGLLMGVCQMIIGVVLQLKLGLHNTLHHGMGIFVVVVICVFASGFVWSWGPLAWLVPSEIYPLEIRSAAQSMSVALNFLSTFVVAQVFLTMLCDLKAGTFFFFSGWLFLMTAIIALFLPETRHVPLERMTVVWKQHWFWRRYPVAENDLPMVSPEKESPARDDRRNGTYLS